MTLELELEHVIGPYHVYMGLLATLIPGLVGGHIMKDARYDIMVGRLMFKIPVAPGFIFAVSVNPMIVFLGLPQHFSHQYFLLIPS